MITNHWLGDSVYFIKNIDRYVDKQVDFNVNIPRIPFRVILTSYN